MSKASLNEVRLIGNLGADPEFRHTSQGTAVATVTMATSYFRGDDEFTEWHRVVLWKHLAERAQKYLHKGASIFVAGRLQTRKWTDGDGVDRWTTEVVAENLQMLGGKRPDSGAEVEPAAGAAPQGGPGLEDTEVPF